jgi:hypothetical protein
MNEGWLSEEACLKGGSIPGVPDLLIGLEKLKDGRGSAEDSEPMDGDRRYEPIPGDAIALAEDSFRGGSEWKEPAMLPEPSSSVTTAGEETLLGVRLL